MLSKDVQPAFICQFELECYVKHVCPFKTLTREQQSPLLHWHNLMLNSNSAVLAMKSHFITNPKSSTHLLTFVSALVKSYSRLNA